VIKTKEKQKKREKMVVEQKPSLVMLG